jgi:hypothetical protein
MTLEDAQLDMRRAYYDGATGVFASATVWLAAAVTAWTVDPRHAIAVLLIGGMLIFPASVLLSKMFGRTGVHAKDNPLASLAVAGTIWMLLAIPVAYGASLYKIEWFFPAMLVTIGGRYLTFPTLYGLRAYAFCGGALAVAGITVVWLKLPVEAGALAGALIELAFGAGIYLKAQDPAVDGPRLREVGHRPNK